MELEMKGYSIGYCRHPSTSKPKFCPLTSPFLFDPVLMKVNFGERVWFITMLD